MRLWHEELLPHLSLLHLMGQHRECCALRGLGWGRKHSTVDYVFRHSPHKLYLYHMLVISLLKGKASIAPEWLRLTYRGKRCQPWATVVVKEVTNPIYPEHDDDYMKECMLNLERKGYRVTRESSIDAHS